MYMYVLEVHFIVHMYMYVLEVDFIVHMYMYVLEVDLNKIICIFECSFSKGR
jgi:hypothetical protein